MPEPEAAGQFADGWRGGWLLVESMNIVSGLLQPVAWDVEFHDDAVMDQAVDGRRRRHRVFEDPLPFGERQVAGQQHTATLIAFSQQREDDLHLLSGLPDVAQIVDDHSFVARVPLEEAA